MTELLEGKTAPVGSCSRDMDPTNYKKEAALWTGSSNSW
jgi:hypothetical protein